MAKPAGLFFQLCVQVLSLSLLGLASCSPKSESSSEKDPPNTIGPDGGTITLQEPDSPLDGMTIDVPNGAYEAKTTFKISSQPYNGEQTGILTPLTPLIHIDNGRRFAKKSITVTIPIALPDGMFAMGFFVNEDGKFEPMPVVALSEKSITVATRHFSEFLIGAISELELPDKIRTNFKPGVDDWQFENHGSYISPDGHCAGQSITAAWYYYEKKLRGEKPLHGRYDNNGGQPTPDIWEDDSLGYRLVSVVQEDIKFDTELREVFNAMSEVSPVLTWKSFLYSMHLTNEPQYVALWDNDEGGGHALVAYAADVKTGVLYVADPNYPGDKTRCIVFFNGVFMPYVSGSNVTDILAGKTSTYEQVIYSAKTAMIPWAKVTSRWAELEAGTIGQKIFPGYGLLQPLKNGGLGEIPDGMQTTKDNLEVEIVAAGNEFLKFKLLRGDKWSALSEKAKIPLELGTNSLGFVIMGERNGQWEWVDFKRLTVERIEEARQSEDDDAEKKDYNAVITGVYYGQLQSNENRSGMMLFVTSEDGKIPLRTAYQILDEKKDDFGNVIETRFVFKKGLGSPGIRPGRWRVCAGPSPGKWTAKSDVVTVGETGTYNVTVGTAP